jgi:plastocyanin
MSGAMTMRISHPRARLAAGFAALLPLGLFMLPHAPAATPPTTHTVAIAYDSSSGTLSVSPDPVNVNPGDQVNWESAAGAWRVAMQSAVPFGAGARSKGIGAQKGNAAGAMVAANAKPGTYKYIVAVYVGGEVHILDPDVVVGPGS